MACVGELREYYTNTSQLTGGLTKRDFCSVSTSALFYNGISLVSDFDGQSVLTYPKQFDPYRDPDSPGTKVYYARAPEGRSVVSGYSSGAGTSVLLDDGSVVVQSLTNDPTALTEDSMPTGFQTSNQPFQFFAPAGDLTSGRPLVAMCGSQTICGVDQDGVVACVGSNSSGQATGDGVASSTAGFTEIPLYSGATPGLKAVDVVCNETIFFHNCAIYEDGTAACWGDNTYGQAGGASPTTAMAATKVPLNKTIVSMAATHILTTIVTDEGDVYYMGNINSVHHTAAFRDLYAPSVAVDYAIGGSGQPEDTAFMFSGFGRYDLPSASSTYGFFPDLDFDAPRPTDVVGCTRALVASNAALGTLEDGSVRLWGKSDHGTAPGVTSNALGSGPDVLTDKGNGYRPEVHPNIFGNTPPFVHLNLSGPWYGFFGLTRANLLTDRHGFGHTMPNLAFATSINAGVYKDGSISLWSYIDATAVPGSFDAPAQIWSGAELGFVGGIRVYSGTGALRMVASPTLTGIAGLVDGFGDNPVMAGVYYSVLGWQTVTTAEGGEVNITSAPSVDFMVSLYPVPDGETATLTLALSTAHWALEVVGALPGGVSQVGSTTAWEGITTDAPITFRATAMEDILDVSEATTTALTMTVTGTTNTSSVLTPKTFYLATESTDGSISITTGLSVHHSVSTTATISITPFPAEGDTVIIDLVSSDADTMVVTPSTLTFTSTATGPFNVSLTTPEPPYADTALYLTAAVSTSSPALAWHYRSASQEVLVLEGPPGTPTRPSPIISFLGAAEAPAPAPAPSSTAAICSNSSPCDLCFTSLNVGTTATYRQSATGEEKTETWACNDTGGSSATACSGMTANGEVGAACRTACSLGANKSTCYEQTFEYCALNKANPDCRCLQPAGTNFTTSTSGTQYTSLQAYVDQNSTVNTDPRCLYAACGGASVASSIIQDATLDCPSVTMSCKVSGVQVTMDDVRAQNINVVTQNCDADGATKHTHVAASTGILGMTSSQSISVLAGVVALVVIVGAAAFFVVRSRRLAAGTKGRLHHAAAVVQAKVTTQHGPQLV